MWTPAASIATTPKKWISLEASSCPGENLETPKIALLKLLSPGMTAQVAKCLGEKLPAPHQPPILPTPMSEATVALSVRSCCSRPRWQTQIFKEREMIALVKVATVVEYYTRWMAKWPTVEHLAASTLEEVQEAWSGLGYYSR